jgi:nucleoid-associated protein YgaU
VVKSGDTLARIAAAHGVSWRTLWAQNRSSVQNPNLIYPGERLSV